MISICMIVVIIEANAQLGPVVTSWIINTNNATGYNNIPSNVQQVQYSTNNVYVSCTCVPDYNIGPWPSNPNVPSNQNFVYKITRNPVQNTSTLVVTPLGHIGVWSNGVSIFNAKDAMSYNNQGFWNQNAIVVEGISFDTCLGHPAPNGEYHHHLNPRCLYDDLDSLNHSPIIGYAFDGFPVYGAYGYSNPNGTGGIRRMQSSYITRNITQRDTLPNGTGLLPSQYGPAVSVSYPLGYYIEDFKYIASSGDLDDHNGRFCVTPDYPSGIYAYFVTIDANQSPVYPYTLGSTYYGTVQAGNTGMNSGHNTISEPVTTYTTTGETELQKEVLCTVFPNPTSGSLTIFLLPSNQNNISGMITNALGEVIHSLENMQPSINYTFDLANYGAGIYFLKLQCGDAVTIKKIAVEK